MIMVHGLLEWVDCSFMVNKRIGFTICFIYSNTLYITKYMKKPCITLPAVYCCLFASKRGYLERFGRILNLPFTVPIHRRTWVESIFFWKASVPEHFPPRKSHCSAFELLIRKAEWITLPLNLPIKNPSRWPGASPQRKLQSHSFRHSKCIARFIHASQKSSCWLPIFDWMSLLNKWLNNYR